MTSPNQPAAACPPAVPDASLTATPNTSLAVMWPRLQRWDAPLVVVPLLLVLVYRRWVSRWLPPACRFSPSCSAYAWQVLLEQPLWRALPLTVWRLGRCQPLCKGGCDLPPPARLTGRMRPTGHCRNTQPTHTHRQELPTSL